MVTSRLSALAVTLAVAGATPLAAGTDPTALMESSYLKIVSALAGGSASYKDHLVILASPGTPIDNQFSMKNPSDRKLLQLLFDRVPKARPVFQVNGNSTYSSVYGKILQNKVTPPPKPLTPEMQRRFDEAMRTTDIKGADYKAYRSALDHFSDAEDEYLDALYVFSQDRTKRVPSRVKSARDLAKENLDALQVKRGSALDVIRQVNAMGGNAWWQSLNKRYDDAKDRETGSYPVEFYPAPETWHVLDPNDKGWTHLDIKTSQMTSDTEYHKMAMDASLGWKSSWSLNINASWSKEALDIVAGDSDATISFDVKRVSVMRPWFAEVTDDQNWAWTDGAVSYGSVLGNAAHGDDTNTKVRPQLPTYVNEVYVARNFVLKAKASDSSLRFFEEKLHVDMGLSVCGFSLGGSFDKHDKTEKLEKYAGSFTLSHPGAEIIGYGASILPQSPMGTPELLKSVRRLGK